MNPKAFLSDPEQYCLQQLKLQIQESPELKPFSEFFEDRFLLHFVRGRKYDECKAFTTLENYFTARYKYRELFISLRPSTNLGLRTGGIRILKNRDAFDRVIAVHRIDLWDPREIPTSEVRNTILLILEEVWNFRDAELHGIVLIFDMTGFKMRHALAPTISQLVIAVSLLWNNFPLRAKKVHVINEINPVKWFYKAVQPILPKKIRDRVVFHGTDMTSFHENLNPSILPKHLGGSLSDEDAFDYQFEQRIRDKEQHYERFATILKADD